MQKFEYRCVTAISPEQVDQQCATFAPDGWRVAHFLTKKVDAPDGARSEGFAILFERDFRPVTPATLDVLAEMVEEAHSEPEPPPAPPVPPSLAPPKRRRKVVGRLGTGARTGSAPN